jgi:hypothetical protein
MPSVSWISPPAPRSPRSRISKLGFLVANLAYGLERPELRDALKQEIEALLANSDRRFMPSVSWISPPAPRSPRSRIEKISGCRMYLLVANLAYGLERPELRDALKQEIEALLAKG